MANVLDSYFVLLGFRNDIASFNKFQEILNKAEKVADSTSSGITKSIAKIGFGIVGTFTAISGTVLTMVDKVAMADQSYRLFGLRMLMTKDSARSLKMATDALGVSMEEMIWDPESNARARILFHDYAQMAKGMGPDFDQNMLKIMSLRFEFTRFGEALKFLSFGFVNDLAKKLGIDDIQEKFVHFNDWFRSELPHIADRLATDVVPILKTTWHLFEAMGAGAKQFGVLFSNVVGALSGDASLKGAEFDFSKLAKAIEKCVGWATKAVDWITNLEIKASHFVTKFSSPEKKADESDLYHADTSLDTKGKGAYWNFNEGRFMRGPAPGGSRSGAQGAFYDFGRFMDRQFNKVVTSAPTNPYSFLIKSPYSLLTGDSTFASVKENPFAEYASKYGIKLSLLEAIAKQESHFNPNAINPASGTMGLMQLMPSTAKSLGIENPFDIKRNIEGGAQTFAYFLQKYHGDVITALAAYDGAAKPEDPHTWKKETQDYVPSVLRYQHMYDTGVVPEFMNAVNPSKNDSTVVHTGDTHINVPMTVTPADASLPQIHETVIAAIRSALNYQTQNTLTQLAPQH